MTMIEALIFWWLGRRYRPGTRVKYANQPGVVVKRLSPQYITVRLKDDHSHYNHHVWLWSDHLQRVKRPRQSRLERRIQVYIDGEQDV